MARATVAEIDKRLSAHEAACEVRWRENWRRLETIETEVKAINKSIRAGLVFFGTLMLAITGFMVKTSLF
jgi:hypothetical protein|tara:strand:- start:125 stop:334 length:210 start_codon:yes stop_codon:yes gene_type:complete